MSEVLFDASGISPMGTLLARYELEEGFRELMGFRSGGEIAVWDVPFPRNSAGPYLVERGVIWEETLESLVRDYVRHSEELGCPAASSEGVDVVVVDSEMEEVEGLLRAAQAV